MSCLGELRLERVDQKVKYEEQTGMTIFPIPSPLMRPILKEFLAASLRPCIDIFERVVGFVEEAREKNATEDLRTYSLGGAVREFAFLHLQVSREQNN